MINSQYQVAHDNPKKYIYDEPYYQKINIKNEKIIEQSQHELEKKLGFVNEMDPIRRGDSARSIEDRQAPWQWWNDVVSTLPSLGQVLAYEDNADNTPNNTPRIQPLKHISNRGDNIKSTSDQFNHHENILLQDISASGGNSLVNSFDIPEIVTKFDLKTTPTKEYNVIVSATNSDTKKQVDTINDSNVNKDIGMQTTTVPKVHKQIIKVPVKRINKVADMNKKSDQMTTQIIVKDMRTESKKKMPTKLITVPVKIRNITVTTPNTENEMPLQTNDTVTSIPVHMRKDLLDRFREQQLKEEKLLPLGDSEAHVNGNSQYDLVLSRLGEDLGVQAMLDAILKTRKPNDSPSSSVRSYHSCIYLNISNNKCSNYVVHLD